MTDTSSIKSQEISANAAQAAEKPRHLHALAHAIAHLNAQVREPPQDYDPAEPGPT